MHRMEHRMDADRLARLNAARLRLVRDAADMADAYRRWDLGRYRDEVRELHERSRLALLEAIRRGAR